ncbi:enoyl-CoA hydratase-related protein [Xanthomonas hortorum pv. pelargonii]|nr:enoyl-CoA hydratase-related protein [Xanthomonas hortorum pv. pelargonii]
MSNHVILIADHASVRTITVNRSDKLNALNQDTMRALDQAFQDAASADDVRVVVLTGAGLKAFVAGADIAEMRDLSAMQGREFSLLGQQLMRRIERMPKPVIAMINGFALGGGLELAMACHLRITAATARLGRPEINLGLIPGFGGTQRLLRLTGRAAALELCLLGQPIDAARALQLGLLNRVVEPEALQEETLALAQRLAAAAPLALRGILDAVVFGGECAIEEGLQLETAQFALLFASDDMREGARAFLEERPAHFFNR